MTCINQYMKEHPDATLSEVIKHYCPWEFYNIDENFEGCTDAMYEYGDCERCWNREIPGTDVKKEKENMPTTRKTKQELVEEIDALKKELENVKNVEQYEEGAYQIKALHTAFMNAGFTDAQAFELILTMIQTNSNINLAAGATRARKF